MQRARSQYKEFAFECVAVLKGQRPVGGLLVVMRGGDFGVKAGVLIELVFFGGVLNVILDFFPTGITLAPVSFAFKREGVHVRLYVTGCPWVGVFAPCAADSVAFVDQDKVGIAFL